MPRLSIAAASPLRRRLRHAEVAVAEAHRDGETVADTTDPGPSFDASDEGSYELTVTAVDLAGNQIAATLHFGIDRTDPTVAIDVPADGSYARAATIRVHGTAVEDNLDTVALDPGAVDATHNAGFWLVEAYDLAEGLNTLTATATDRAGRQATAEVTVTLDTIAPDVTLTAPADGTLTSAATIDVTGEATDADLDRVLLAGRELADLDGSPDPFAFTEPVSLAEGLNEIRLAAWDVAGNAAAVATISVTRDSRCPGIIVHAPGDGHTTAAATVRFTAYVSDASAIDEFTVGGEAAPLTDGAFDHTVSLTDGENPIEVRAVDAADNECAVTVTVHRDVTGPELTSFTPAANDTGVALGQDLVLEFSDPVSLGSGDAGLVVSVAGAAEVKGSVVVFRPAGGWPSDDSVSVEVTAAVTDERGNPLSNPQAWSFATADATPPSLTLDPLPDVTTQLSIDVAGDTEPDAVVSVRGDAESVEGEAGANGRFELTLALVESAVNQIVVTAADAAGNVSAPAVDFVRQETTAPVVVSAVLDDPVPPPEAVIGAALAGVDEPQQSDTLDPAMSATPDTIFPSGRSEARVELQPAAPMTSGIPLQVDVAESLTLLDDAQVTHDTYVADVTSYRAETEFPVQPRNAPSFDLYKEGRIRLKVYEFPENAPTGSVVGRDGGTASSGDWGMTVPSGAVDGPTPVIMTARAGDELPAPVPADFEFLKAVEVSFGGAELRAGAKLDVDASDLTLSAGDRLLLLRVGAAFGGPMNSARQRRSQRV